MLPCCRLPAAFTGWSTLGGTASDMEHWREDRSWAGRAAGSGGSRGELDGDSKANIVLQ
jgi:hypothetical protein